MGCLLNFPFKFYPRRWRSLYHGRQGYLSLQADKGGHLDGLICTDHYDDKYVVSCDGCAHDHDRPASRLLATSDTNHDNDIMDRDIEVDHGSNNYDSDCGCDYKYDINYDTCQNSSINVDNYYRDINYEVFNKDDINYDTCQHKSTINVNNNYRDSKYEICKDGNDNNNQYRGVEASDDDDGDEACLITTFYHAQEPYPLRKKRIVRVKRRARGLEGYWQRQAYLHSAYKFTRRKSMRERATVPIRKLRTAWGMVRGMYAKQARRMRGKIRSISNYAKFHHISLLLLSKHYLQYPASSLSSPKRVPYFQQH